MRKTDRSPSLWLEVLKSPFVCRSAFQRSRQRVGFGHHLQQDPGALGPGPRDRAQRTHPRIQGGLTAIASRRLVRKLGSVVSVHGVNGVAFAANSDVSTVTSFARNPIPSSCSDLWEVYGECRIGLQKGFSSCSPAGHLQGEGLGRSSELLGGGRQQQPQRPPDGSGQVRPLRDPGARLHPHRRREEQRAVHLGKDPG